MVRADPAEIGQDNVAVLVPPEDKATWSFGAITEPQLKVWATVSASSLFGLFCLSPVATVTSTFRLLEPTDVSRRTLTQFNRLHCILYIPIVGWIHASNQVRVCHCDISSLVRMRNKRACHIGWWLDLVFILITGQNERGQAAKEGRVTIKQHIMSNEATK